MGARLKIIIAVVVVIILTTGWFLFDKETVPEETPIEEVPAVEVPPTPTSTSPVKIIGSSVLGRNIESYTFGTGSTTLLFVGGVHGGYEWNSSSLAYQFIAEIATGTFLIPEELKVVIVPTLNPDGLFAVTKLTGAFTDSDVVPNTSLAVGTGRMNANGVDLNRNFACKWKPESTWRNKVVSAGTAPFSEPEAVALRDLVEDIKPTAVIFWHSQANTVYGSECLAGVLPETLSLMNTYAKAASYKTLAQFTAYPITGDAEGWLASIGIPAVTVELETHQTSEWKRNRAGISAVMAKYAKGE